MPNGANFCLEANSILFLGSGMQDFRYLTRLVTLNDFPKKEGPTLEQGYTLTTLP